MVVYVIAFVGGASLFQLFSTLPSSNWLLLFLPLIFLWIRYPNISICWAFVAGLLWALLHAALILSSELPLELERQNVEVTGCIASLPEKIGRRVRFQFDIEKMEYEGRTVSGPGRVRLSWYSSKNNHQLIAGDCWQLLVRMKRPHGSYNPGGMDYEGWLFREGIRASGYIRQWDGNRRIERNRPEYFVHRIRQQIGQKLQQIGGHGEGLALLKALTIGDRSGLTSAHWQTYSKTGTNHLVAISGLHIGIAAGWVFFLTRLLWSRCSWLTQRLPAPTAAAVLALCSAIIYAALAGFSVPTQRALVMLAILLLAKILNRSICSSQTLAAALLAVVFFDPPSILSPGFWLSFSAVAVILFAMGNRLKVSSWRQWGEVQWVVAIGLIPLLLIFFSQVSLISPLVNLIAVPIFTLLLVPLALMVLLLLPLPALAEPLLSWVSQLLVWSGQGLSYAASMPISVWQSGYLPGWIWPSTVLAVLLFLLPRGVPGRWLGFLLLLPPLMIVPERPKSGEFYFTLLDVGQGLSAVVQTEHHTLVYDAGARFSDRFDVGSAIVLPFLQFKGIQAVDQVVVSNGDADHAGGVAALYQGIPVVNVMSGEPERLEDIPAVRCQAGMQWDWDGVRFSVLHPTQDERLKGNDLSCVVLISNGAASLLLTGDIERKAEKILLATDLNRLDVDIVQVPHHGSKTSSSLAFVDAISAEYAVVSAGYKNRFSFPKIEVQQRWSTSGAAFYNTAKSGSLAFRVGRDGQIDGPIEERKRQGHYWSESIW